MGQGRSRAAVWRTVAGRPRAGLKHGMEVNGMADDIDTLEAPLHLAPGTPLPAETFQADPMLAGDADGDGVRRRDFINVAALSFAGVGALFVVPALLNQMNPSADVLAESSVEADLSQIEPGQSVKTVWRKQPVFLRNLTPAEIQAANSVDVGSLRDPQTLAERTKEGKANWLITLGVCTHLGCIPLGAASGETKGEYGGYFCPCHGSHYDTAARVRKGPAPSNLVVPEYEFTTDTTIQIG